MTIDPQDHLTQFWNSVASGYEAHPGNVADFGTDEYRVWVESVRAGLPSAPSDVLDVGTGTGFMALIVAALGHRVTAIDLSSQMLDLARATAEERGLAVRFGSGDAVDPDFPPASFDVVINRHLLWTLREPERAMRNWRRLLRPGGRTVAIDGFWCGPPPSDEETASDEPPEIFEQHYTPETRAALPLMHADRVEAATDLFRSAGFSDVATTNLTSLANKAVDGVTPYLIVARP